MARTTGTTSLADLIQRGLLRSGEPLVLRRRSAPPIEGKLEGDGSITIGGISYSSPSTAARHVLTGHPIDGWLRWRVPRLGDRSLAELREGK
ncbi:MAG: hypothetical protein IT307_03295 [Chloroflexi bacterium]|nr:hypothetical protein [Chloroflexota bacterium]